MKSISEIRTEFEACRGSRAELYEMYAYDTRMGVQKLRSRTKSLQMKDFV